MPTPKRSFSIWNCPVSHQRQLPASVGAAKKLLEVGGRMVLCSLSPAVVEIFQTTWLIGSAGAFFEVQPDVDAAIASLLREPESPQSPAAP